MTREEIEPIRHGDLNAMAKLAKTIRQTTRPAGPILSQFCSKATEIPDFISPGSSISGPTRSPRSFLTPPRTVTSTENLFGPAGGPRTLPVGRQTEDEAAPLSGDYNEAHEEMAAFVQRQRRFEEALRQMFPTIPLEHVLRPGESTPPLHWNLERAVKYDEERREKARYQRVADDPTVRLSIRKAAMDVVRGYEVTDSRMRAAIQKHNANLAAREILRDHLNDPSYKLALQALVNDTAVPRGVRLQAQAELDGLGA